MVEGHKPFIGHVLRMKKDTREGKHPFTFTYETLEKNPEAKVLLAQRGPFLQCVLTSPELVEQLSSR